MEKTAPGLLLLVMVTAQLSVTVGGVQLTVRLHAFAGAFTVMFVGQPVITGVVASTTITLNAQVDCLPEASVAVYVTGVVPTEKNCPGLLSLVRFTTQLSVAVGGVQLTLAPHVPAVETAFTVMFDGQPVMTGLVTSFTTTLKLHVDVRPDASVAV